MCNLYDFQLEKLCQKFMGQVEKSAIRAEENTFENLQTVLYQNELITCKIEPPDTHEGSQQTVGSQGEVRISIFLASSKMPRNLLYRTASDRTILSLQFFKEVSFSGCRILLEKLMEIQIGFEKSKGMCCTIEISYCRVAPLTLQWRLLFSGVRTVVEGLDAWSSHNANEASNLCELVTVRCHF